MFVANGPPAIEDSTTPDDAGTTETSEAAQTPSTTGKASAQTPVTTGKASAQTPVTTGKTSARTSVAAGKGTAQTPATTGKAAVKPVPMASFEEDPDEEHALVIKIIWS